MLSKSPGVIRVVLPEHRQQLTTPSPLNPRCARRAKPERRPRISVFRFPFHVGDKSLETSCILARYAGLASLCFGAGAL